MRRNKENEVVYRNLAKRFGINQSDVRKIVLSFFDQIALEARSLPFDNQYRIYSRQVFENASHVASIPYIGRIGPVYSRYLKWRANISKDLDMVPRENYRLRLTQDDIENIAASVLAGRTPSIVKRKNKELFDNIWLVDTGGKKLARQVIKKK
jgi:hypothetical protein